jgi:hypothetical protein
MFTYSVEVSLSVVLFPSVKIIIDGDEAGGSAASELGLQAEDSHAVLSRLESLANLSLDGGLLDASHFGVDEVDRLGKRKRMREERDLRTHCFLPRRGFTMTFRM